MNNNENVSDKRTKIIKAAVEVFSSKGFHHAKVEEIAQIADVGKGTVYEYFSSKADLFQELFRVGMEFYLNSMTEEMHSVNKPADKLTKIARLHFKFIFEYKELAKITMTEHAHFNDEFRGWLIKIRQEKLKAIEDIIAGGIKEGAFAKVDPGAAAMLFLGLMGSLFGPAVFENRDRQYLESTLQEMLDIFLRGLKINP